MKTKEKIVGIITKLGAYISPNLKKDETARRAAAILLDDPQLVLDDLNKDELKLVKEFVDAGPNAYITRKMRKMPYKLQKYALVLTYEDFDADADARCHPSVLCSIHRRSDSLQGEASPQADPERAAAGRMDGLLAGRAGRVSTLSACHAERNAVRRSISSSINH